MTPRGDMPEYAIGRIVFGSAASVDAAYRLFREQPIDEERLLAADAAVPFPARRRTLSGEAQVAGIGTFKGSARQTITFAPSERPGYMVHLLVEIIVYREKQITNEKTNVAGSHQEDKMEG